MNKRLKAQAIWTDKPHNFLGLPINFTRYILTEDKLLIRNGFFNIKQEEILLYRILDKVLNLPLGQRIFGCGTVTVTARDATSPEVTLKSIKDAEGVIDILDDLVEKAKRKNNAVGRDMYGASGSFNDPEKPYGDDDGSDGDHECGCHHED